MLNVVEPYEIDYHFVVCEAKDAQHGDEYSDLFGVARKLTPQGNKLFFPPGQYSFSMADYNLFALEFLKRTINDTTKSTGTESEKDNDQPYDFSEVEVLAVPSDFELVVGKGKKQKTFATNKVILSCISTGFEAMVGDFVVAKKFELPDLDPVAVQVVLDYFTTRKKVVMSKMWDPVRFPLQQQVLEKFRIIKKTGEPPY